MRSLAARFLSEADRENVRRRVRDVEASTSAEIVPLIRSASSAYRAAVLRGALAAGAVLAAGATALDAALMPWGALSLLDLWVYPVVFAICFAVVFLLSSWIPSLAKLLVSRAEMSAEVAEAAITSFYRHRVSETRGRTGILLFVSVFERRVVVLADAGISAKVPQDTWQQVVDIVLEGIRAGRAADGLCRAITRCGEIVAAQLPILAEDTNELGDLIVED